MLKAIPILLLTLILALVLVVVVDTAVPVSAATAGPNNAGTGSNVNGPGTVNWTDPGYITAGDTSYATAILGGAATSEYLQGTNYGFSIPLDATINGITVSIMRMDSSGNGAIDADLYLLKAATIVGLNHADTITKWPKEMPAAPVTYGGTADLWGTTWTPDEINATGFGVSLSAYNGHPIKDRPAYVDYMQITVTYTPAPTPTTLTVTAASGTYGSTCNLTATLTVTADGAPIADKPVNFTLNAVLVPGGPYTTDALGVANVPAADLTGIDVGGYPAGVGASFAGDASYGASSGTNSLTVTQRDLTVTATGINKAYDGTDNATVNLTTDALGGDTVTASYGSATFADNEVGTGKDVSVSGISISGSDAGNYNLLNTLAATTADITPKELTITGIAGVDKVYDGTTDATVDPTGASLVGVEVGDNVTVDITSASATFDNRNVGDDKTITVTGLILTSPDAGNYTLIPPTTTADIWALAITVTADNAGKTYGDGDPALSYQITSGSLAVGDTFTGDLVRVTGEDVDTYAIQQGSLAIDDGNGGNNYDLTFVDGVFTIGLRSITVTADNAGKTYGDGDPALTYQITSGSLAVGDTFTGDLVRVTGEDVDTYAIQQGSLAIDDGNGGLNYDLTFVDGVFTIWSEPLKLDT
jgi:hypothetical protein